MLDRLVEKRHAVYRQELEAKLTSGKDIFHEDWCALAP